MGEIGEFFSKLFSTEGFPARWHCGSWSSFLGWFTILSDATIWLAYFIIPVILIMFIQRRKDLPFPPVFWLFGSFIVLCGTTHILDVVIFWSPIYRIAALVRFATAVVSMFTVFQVVKILPQALSLKSPEALEKEKTKRLEAEKELDRLREENAKLARSRV